MKSQKGFTLIELLVVIGIIGILAAIAISQFSSYRHRGFDADVRSAVKNLITVQEAYFVDNGFYTTGVGTDFQFISLGFRMSPNINISTTAVTPLIFTITGNAIKGCSAGTGVWNFDNTTSAVTGVNCN